MTKTTTLFPFESLKKKHSLTYEEEAVLLYLLETHVREETPVSIKELIEFLQNFAENKLKLRLLFKKESKLIKKGLIGTKEDSFSYEGSRKKRVILNEDIMAEILGEKKKRKNRKKELFLKNDLFDVIKPNISFDGVVLHPKTEGQIKDILEMSYGEVSNLLTTWGFKLNRSCETSLAKKKRPSLTMIFYGPPGTGKTLTAQAISTRLNCELLTFDCSKIIDMWVGESQKNVKKIFTQYQDISSKIKTPPVLLLNEADQFLHQRLAADRSTDQMYNQMQNIFLEQLEQFEGVLIATTNLINNIDSAFSRRFDYKVEFKRPGIEERIRLWKALVPKEAPLSPDVDFATLSKKYDFSGGQLSVVIRNAAIKAARRGSSLSQRDFISTCEEEMSGNFDEKAKTKAPVQ
ncbi:MAG: ATP-binding protein [Nitrospirae bacterium]|nr:ATP-binding protein [Nitrospirota bacterium]